MKNNLSDLTLAQLWQLFPIILTEYSPLWSQWFAEEKRHLEKLLAEDVLDIHHIGSTAIPGIPAKPTIDMLVQIKATTNIEQLCKTLLSNGYLLNRPEDKPLPQLVLLKGYTQSGFAEKVFHVHIRYPGDCQEVAFRDYLLAHSEAAAEYGRLKTCLAQKHKYDRDAYTQAKSDFVEKIKQMC